LAREARRFQLDEVHHPLPFTVGAFDRLGGLRKRPADRERTGHQCDQDFLSAHHSSPTE
jgi:hypothetical protein